MYQVFQMKYQNDDKIHLQLTALKSVGVCLEVFWHLLEGLDEIAEEFSEVRTVHQLLFCLKWPIQKYILPNF